MPRPLEATKEIVTPRHGADEVGHGCRAIGTMEGWPKIPLGTEDATYQTDGP
jgi:hypothetical protein